jgi:hypothetical protein
MGKLQIKFARLQAKEDTRLWTEFEATNRTKETALFGLASLMLILLIYGVSSIGLSSALDVLVFSLVGLSVVFIGLIGWRHRTNRIQKLCEREAVLRASKID